VGYTGGTNAKPTYGSVCGGDGHTEALKVTFDPSVVSFSELLDTFWSLHNPTARYNTQYMSAIWPQNQEQSRIVAESIGQKEEKSVLPIATVVDGTTPTFYKAEWYHQNYKAKNRIRLAVFALYIALPYLPPFQGQELLTQVLAAALFVSYVPQLVSTFDKVLP